LTAKTHKAYLEAGAALTAASKKYAKVVRDYANSKINYDAMIAAYADLQEVYVAYNVAFDADEI
jgi:hypothetical protein